MGTDMQEPLLNVSDNSEDKRRLLLEQQDGQNGGQPIDTTREDSGAGEQVFASNRQTFMNVLKGNVGPGCLSLPFAFSKAGALLGPLGFFLLSSMAVYNMHLLISCRERLRREGRWARTYGEVAGIVFGKVGKPLVDTFIVLTQLGICCVYFSFFGDSFPSEDILGKARAIPYAYMAALAFPIVLLLIIPKQVKNLAIFSAMSNFLICTSILWVLTESCRYDTLLRLGPFACLSLLSSLIEDEACVEWMIISQQQQIRPISLY